MELSADNKARLAAFLDNYNEEIRQRGGTHNASDRVAAKWMLGSAGLSGVGLAALATSAPQLVAGKIPLPRLALAAIAGGGAVAAKLKSDQHFADAEIIRRQQFPQLYDENGQFIKAAMFVPGNAYASSVLRRGNSLWHGLWHSGAAYSSPKVEKAVSGGMRGLVGREAMLNKAKTMEGNTFQALRQRGYPDLNKTPLNEVHQALRAPALAHEAAVTRGDRLRFLAENQWQKPALKARAGVNQMVNRVKNFNAQPVAMPTPNFAPAI